MYERGLKLKFQQKNPYNKDGYHQEFETTPLGAISRTDCTPLGCMGSSVIWKEDRELWEKMPEEISAGRGVAELRVSPFAYLGELLTPKLVRSGC